MSTRSTCQSLNRSPQAFGRIENHASAFGDGHQPCAYLVGDGDEPPCGRLGDLRFDADESGSEVDSPPIQATQLGGAQSAKGSDGERGDQVFGAVVQQFAKLFRAEDPGFGGGVASEINLGDLLHDIPVRELRATSEMQQAPDQPKLVVEGASGEGSPLFFFRNRRQPRTNSRGF
jgi:hypothetical protein